MPYTKTVWTNETPATSPVKYKFTDDSLGVIANSAKIEVVTSITAGTPVNATNLNKLETGLQTAAAIADDAQNNAMAAYTISIGNIAKSLFTTAGDLLYATASATVARLAAGTARKKLQINALGTAPEWVGANIAILKRVASLTLTTGTYISVIWDTEVSDTDNIWTVGSPTLLTIPFAGNWLITANISFGNNASGIRVERIMHGGSFIAENKHLPVSGDVTGMTITAADVFAASDTVELVLYQNSGSDVGITARIVMTYLGA